MPENIPPTILAALRCPVCRQEGVIERGGFVCRRAHLTPWRDGYLDAATVGAPADRTTRRTNEAFGYEWTRFSQVKPEDEIFWRRYFADVDLADLAGRLGLDAGCGQGRYSRFTAAHLAALVASDGSNATAAAATNLAGLPNVCVVKADLRTMPFEAGSFGFISCLGVLHQLPDPRAGLDALAQLLAPGGQVLVYLYSRPNDAGLRWWSLRAAGAMRRFTVRMPKTVLRPLCWPLAGLLYAVFVMPGAMGERWKIGQMASLPLATYRGHRLRALWLDTFDRLSAPLEARFTPAEAETMFARCGLSVKVLRTDRDLVGIVVLAEKRPT
jgi:SAM-dependent methyltransferase